MAAGAPWSVKGIDPKAREVAKELARRSGMTLGDWLTRVILEDDDPEDVASEAQLSARPPRLAEAFRHASPPGEGAADAAGVVRSLDRLTGRIEASETRTGLAIAGIEHSVREALTRIEAAEREQYAVAVRLDALAPAAAGLRSEVGPRSVEALRALYGDEVEIPGGAGVAVGAAVEQLGERLAAAEMRTGESLEGLRSALAALDERVRNVEAGAGPGVERRLEALAHDLRRQVEAERAAAAEQVVLARAPLEHRLAQMSDRLAAAEARSGRAIERMGREVLTLAEALQKRLQNAEQQSADAADQMSGEVARLGASLDARLARAEQAQAMALQRLGDEISLGAERLTERVGASERRAAQAIEDVGEQVARVTERIEHRHERLSDDFAERLRQSEARTAKLLEDARRSLEARMAGAQARLERVAPNWDPPGRGGGQDGGGDAADTSVLTFRPELLARVEEAADDLGPEPPPASAAAFEDEDDFAPIAEVEDVGFDEGFDDVGASPEPGSANLSTREVIEQARLAARAAAEAQGASPAERRPLPTGSRRLFPNLGFRARVRPPSTWQTALLAAGGAAFLSVGAAGVVLMEGAKPAGESASLAPDGPASAPRAAVALATPSAETASPRPAADYAAAVRDLEAGRAGALARLKAIATGGYAPAQFFLAKLYETGQFGVLKSVPEARRWTAAAAESGDRSAMHNLALYEFRGEGGPQDLAQAAAWFRRAAEAGVVDSQYNLGLLYETGSGVRRDDALAYMWFSIAADGGDPQARANAAELAPRLSAAARGEALKAAAAFRSREPDTAAGELVEAQRVLARLGYFQGAADGSASPALKVALSAYQRDHGLSPTGALDPPTAARLSVLTR